MISSVRSLWRCVLGTLILFAHSLALGSPVYQFTQLPFGDTVGAVDINDLGVIAYAGFGDAIPNGASYIAGSGFVQGYDPIFQFSGVQVTDIDNAGDLLGTALKTGGWVPTIWLNGVPYDLTDPANVGLAFVLDPGPKWVNFDIASLEVLDLPFVPGINGTAAGSALTNARGELVFDYKQVDSCCDQIGLLSLVVPEPPALALTLLALGIAFGVSVRSKALPD